MSGAVRRPVHEALAALASRRSLHMPGHKGVAPFGQDDLYALDTTEFPLSDDLYAPERFLNEAQRLYARAAGAGATLFLHNGSTAGIHVMLQLWAREGDTVLLPRNAHLSSVNACVIGGLQPVWIPVRQTDDGMTWLAGADVLAAIAAHPEAKALLLTRPDYYGGMIPLRCIAEAAHAAGIRLIVDEAHGAHLPWLPGYESAGACGADAWTQSVHKTLPGLTGTAVLHLRDEADRPAALRLLRREQTSSPSFVLMQAIDDSRAWMEVEGAARLQTLTAALDALRTSLRNSPYADAHEAWRGLTDYDYDPTRLVISAPQGGDALATELAARGWDVEMWDQRRVVCILTAMDDPKCIRELGMTLAELPAKARQFDPLPTLTPLPKQTMLLRRAAMGQTEAVPFRQAAGRIAACAAGLYPPGIPLVCPGEQISGDIIARLTQAQAQNRFGIEGEKILCVKEDA